MTQFVDTNMDDQDSISSQVTQTLETYFGTLEDECPSDLYEMVLQQVEPSLLQFVLNKTDFNQTKTAEILGINRNTLRKKMLKYGLSN